MSGTRRLKFDEIGYWSEIKLDIVKDYASAYSQILAAQTNPSLHHVYIDAFAGAGVHISKATGEYVQGSPTNALLVHPPFREYYLIDIDRQKVTRLRDETKDRKDVHIDEGDCNRILLENVFPNVRWEQYRRGLCLLDPYGLQLDWKVIETAGKMGSIDMFLNFPVADMNRNVLWRNPEGVDAADLKRMHEFWGDESWREIAYTTKLNLFGYPEKEEMRSWLRDFASAFLRSLDSNTCRSRCRCGAQREQPCTTCSSRHRNPLRKILSSTFSRSTGNGERSNGCELPHRMD
jgi:three-Cys-motif partner protein